MAARLKVFLDKECTKELYRNSEGRFFFRYYDDILNRDYIDGNEGAKRSFTLYLKNIGSRAALHPRVIVVQKEERFSNVFSEREYAIGKDIPVDAVAEVTLSFIIASWTEAQVNTTELILDYYSLPDQTPEIAPSLNYYTLQDETNFNIKQEGPDVDSNTSEEGNLNE